MSKIKLVTDSCCDIPVEISKNLDIEVLCIPIAVDGKSYLERQDFTNQEFYHLLLKSKEIPSTSRINTTEYLECYRRAARQGYEGLINVIISGTGSGTFESAQMAAELFKKEEPELASKMCIQLIDSRSYCMGYGYAVIQAAKMLRQGATFEDTVSYIQEWVDSVEIYLACYTLDFAKKSGRISSTAAFVGELLGLRPVIRMVDGQNQVIEKVRGDKNVVPAVCKQACRSLVKGGEYLVVKGMFDEPANELARLLTEKLGYPPKGIYSIGPSVATNSGPNIVAVILRGARRHS